MSKVKWDYRDVSAILRKFRQFLLGRKHELDNLHVRFPPRISPRSIPTPNIFRGPESINKYHDQWYCDRSAKDGVKPPIVGPLGEGPAYPLDCTKTPQPTTNLKPDELSFACPPTPGTPWWWDGHNYYDCKPEEPEPKTEPAPCPSPPSDPCAKR